MFAIGAFADLSGISAKALRLYDRMGLFRPAWTDAATRYRYYSAAQLPELRRIVALRNTGMPLAEIARVRHPLDLRAALEQRRRELEAQRADLERRLAALAIRFDSTNGDDTDSALDTADVVVRTLEPQLVASRAIASHEDVADAFYELETHVRNAGARAPRPPGVVLGDDAEAQRIFVPIRRLVPAGERITVERLASVRAATTLHHGSYAGLGEARASLDRWIERAGMAPSGSLRILYLQFGAERELQVPSAFIVERDADFVTELQQPVASA